MARKVWEISGYDGLELIFKVTVPRKELSHSKATALLQRLAAGHLTEEEVISSSLRKRAAGYRPLLEVRRDGHWLTIGAASHWVACIKEVK
jgi:hypothetical protein